MLFDSHNHLQSAKFGDDPGKYIRDMQRAGVRGCVVNATQESDWARVRGLAERFPGFVHAAYGIHPWFADTARAGWEGRLRAILEADARASVGEVGVDGWVDSPGMEVQKPVFAAQVEIAAELGRNLTIHCLKAWQPLFEVMEQAEQAGRWPEKFLMHSFGGSGELAERLMKREGVMFSFSGYFLQPRKRKVLELFKQLPQERILLETDAPEMMPPEDFVEFPLGAEVNHPANLGAIAREFESELGGGIPGPGGGILNQVAENSRLFWGLGEDD